MKKYLTAIIIAGTTFGANAIDISGCEKISEPSPLGDWIVKCDASEELRKIQSGEANAMFMSSLPKGLDSINEMIADSEHVYVNIVPDDCGPNTTGYRIFKQIEKFEDGVMYATTVCE